MTGKGIDAGLTYDTQARSRATAFSPRRPAAARGMFSVRDEQGTRPAGETHAADDRQFNQAPGLGRAEAGVRAHAAADDQGGADSGNRAGITSLSAERANASRLLELTRKHWGIENGLHYRRDVTMGEDASRVRKGAAPQVMAALRNTIIHALDELGDNLAAAMRTLNNCFSQALSFIGLPQHE